MIFSVAAKGFQIQNGKISSPVKQMTIAGNFFRVFYRILKKLALSFTSYQEDMAPHRYL
ncbi:metallopeptidase TldD-related protein [Lysinibacillus sp. MHQ-1]|nr:metallopeptidase TldD-related protein [Lysinibacillus sp. MHQ-1]